MAYTAQVQDLATLADVREYMRHSNVSVVTNDDDILQRLITAVSEGLAEYCSRKFEAQQFVETRNGRGEVALAVRNPDIISVLSVVIDTYTVTQAANALAGGWVNDDLFVYIRQGYTGSYLNADRFTRGIQNVVLTYWAGWSTPGQGANNITFPPPAWAATHAYTAKQLILDSNNNIEIVTTAGTSGGTAPTWSTIVGGTTSDPASGGGVTWTNLGAQPTGGLNPPALPYDIQQACIELVILAQRQRPMIGASSVGQGPQRIAYMLKGMTDAGQVAIARYINHALPLR